MSVPLTINGALFNYPVTFDTNWGVDATGWAQAVTAGMLQKAGGTFTLTADVNFGASFGLLAAYFETRSANPSTVGTIRLSPADAGIGFRNNAHNANLILTTDASDNLLYNGHIITASATSPVTSITGTVNQVIASSATGAVTLSLPQSIALSSTPTFGGEILSGILVMQNTSGVAYQDSGSVHTILMQAPSTTANYTLTLPPTSGSSGQVLRTDGAGTTTWVNAAGGGTVNSGTTPNIPYYATSSNVLSDSGISRANLFLADGTVPATGAFNLASHKITSLTNGSSAQDAVAFTQLSTGNAITAGGITNNTITATQIANATVTTTQVASNTLTGSTANSGGSAGNTAQGTISTPDLRANAVTQAQNSASGTSGDATAITTKSITTIGGPILVFASATVATTISAGSASALLNVTRAGTSITGASVRGLATAGTNWQFPLSLAAVDTPTAGTYSYHLTHSSAGTSISVIEYSLVLVELRA